MEWKCKYKEEKRLCNFFIDKEELLHVFLRGDGKHHTTMGFAFKRVVMQFYVRMSIF